MIEPKSRTRVIIPNEDSMTVLLHIKPFSLRSSRFAFIHLSLSLGGVSSWWGNIHLRVVKNLRNYCATKPSIIHIHTSGKNISLATHGVRNLFRSSLGRSSLVVKNLREIGMQSQFIVLRVIAFSISNVYISHPVSKMCCDVIAIWINCSWKRVSLDDILLSLSPYVKFFQTFFLSRDAYDPRVSAVLS